MTTTDDHLAAGRCVYELLGTHLFFSDCDTAAFLHAQNHSTKTVWQRQLVNFVLSFYKTLHLLWRYENFLSLMVLGLYMKKLRLSFEQKIKCNEIF